MSMGSKIRLADSKNKFTRVNKMFMDCEIRLAVLK
jgi:hypothetical protein